MRLEAAPRPILNVQNNYFNPPTGPRCTPEDCPKCGSTMEPIDPAMEGPPLEQLQLCPACYLVMWKDETGFQVRQGVPVPNASKPRNEVN